MSNSENYIITISREFGSLGRLVAEKLSELLDIEYYDRDIVEKVAKETDISVPVISEQEEKVSKYWTCCFPLGVGTSDLQDKIFYEQYNIIKNLAENESCIIVGRCADYILKNHPRCMNVHIYAPYEKRLKNSIENLGMNRKEAEKIIKKTDQARRAYHLKYAKYAPDDIKHKDILIDSSVSSIEGTAKIIEFMARLKFKL